MTTRVKIAAWTGLLIVTLLIVSVIGFMSKPISAQAQDTQALELYQLLKRLDGESKSLTFTFDRPFLSGETLLTVPDTTFGRELGEIGLNYVCFSEPWNNTRRVQCTPYSNIVSVTYEQ